MLWQRNDGWIGAPVDDSFVLLSVATGEYVALNPTASDVWDLLNEPRDADMLVATLTTRFRVAPEECRAAVDRLLAKLAAHAMIRPLGGNESAA